MDSCAALMRAITLTILAYNSPSVSAEAAPEGFCEELPDWGSHRALGCGGVGCRGVDGDGPCLPGRNAALPVFGGGMPEAHAPWGISFSLLWPCEVVGCP